LFPHPRSLRLRPGVVPGLHARLGQHQPQALVVGVAGQ